MENESINSIRQQVHSHSLPKAEKLCSDKLTAALFANGTSFVKFPLRVVYSAPRVAEDSVRCQILTSVPKKRFKRAVKRNRIKRLFREAYRLNKHILVDKLEGRRIDIAFVCIDSNEPTFFNVQKSMVAALNKIAEAVSSHSISIGKIIKEAPAIRKN